MPQIHIAIKQNVCDKKLGTKDLPFLNQRRKFRVTKIHEGSLSVKELVAVYIDGSKTERGVGAASEMVFEYENNM